jgi:hypothetical protein
MTMTLIETKTLGTAAASIEFTSIPQDGTDLVVLQSCRFAGAVNDISLRLNNSTSGYSMRILFGDGSGTGSANNSSGFLVWSGQATRSTFTANTFANSMVYIPNYSGSTQKSISVDGVTENNATLSIQSISAGLWTDTAAITSVSFSAGSGGENLDAGSTISLYKITKGSDGIVTTS